MIVTCATTRFVGAERVSDVEVTAAQIKDRQRDEASSFTTNHLPGLEVNSAFVDDPTNDLSFMVTVPSVPEAATYLAYFVDGELDSIRDIVPGRVQDIRAENLPEEFTLQVVATSSKPTAGLAGGDKSLADVAPEVQASAVAASPEYRIVKP